MRKIRTSKTIKLTRRSWTLCSSRYTISYRGRLKIQLCHQRQGWDKRIKSQRLSMPSSRGELKEGPRITAKRFTITLKRKFRSKSLRNRSNLNVAKLFSLHGCLPTLYIYQSYLRIRASHQLKGICITARATLAKKLSLKSHPLETSRKEHAGLFRQ